MKRFFLCVHGMFSERNYVLIQLGSDRSIYTSSLAHSVSILSFPARRQYDVTLKRVDGWNNDVVLHLRVIRWARVNERSLFPSVHPYGGFPDR